MNKKTFKQILSAFFMTVGLGILVYASRISGSTGFAVKEVIGKPITIFFLVTGLILFTIGYLLFRNTRY